MDQPKLQSEQTLRKNFANLFLFIIFIVFFIFAYIVINVMNNSNISPKEPSAAGNCSTNYIIRVSKPDSTPAWRLETNLDVASCGIFNVQVATTQPILSNDFKIKVTYPNGISEILDGNTLSNGQLSPASKLVFNDNNSSNFNPVRMLTQNGTYTFKAVAKSDGAECYSATVTLSGCSGVVTTSSSSITSSSSTTSTASSSTNGYDIVKDKDGWFVQNAKYCEDFSTSNTKGECSKLTINSNGTIQRINQITKCDTSVCPAATSNACINIETYIGGNDKNSTDKKAWRCTDVRNGDSWSDPKVNTNGEGVRCDGTTLCETPVWLQDQSVKYQTIGGKVTDEKGVGLKDITVNIQYHPITSDAISFSEVKTDINGFYKLENKVIIGMSYKVSIPVLGPAVTSYIPPTITAGPKNSSDLGTNIGWTKRTFENVTVKRDTQTTDNSYEYQKAGENDCAGLRNNIEGTSLRCNFVYISNADCQNLYWFDSTDKTCDTPKKFCGAYMYESLRTFKTQNECKVALPNSSSTSVTTQKSCIVSGCNAEICAEKSMESICVYKDEFVCYKSAECKVQTDGNCGWTQTESLKKCLSTISTTSTSSETTSSSEVCEILDTGNLCKVQFYKNNSGTDCFKIWGLEDCKKFNNRDNDMRYIVFGGNNAVANTCQTTDMILSSGNIIEGQEYCPTPAGTGYKYQQIDFNFKIRFSIDKEGKITSDKCDKDGLEPGGTCTQVSKCSKYDLNSDGVIDILNDYVLFRGEYRKFEANNKADFDNNGRVDIYDYVLFRGAFYKHIVDVTCDVDEQTVVTPLFCGGPANLSCPSGYTCKFSGDAQDSNGICTKQ